MTLRDLLWIIIASVAALCWNGCKAPERIDQCVRREVFNECMAALPKGPERITAAGNDWDEVVDSCANFAQYAAVRYERNIPRGCR